MKPQRHILFFSSILLLASLACATLSGGSPPPAAETDAPSEGNPPATNVPAPTQPPTNPPAPTRTPAPTNIPVPVAQEFFTEEFEDDTYADQWYYFPFGPGSEDDKNLKIFQEGDGLTIDLGALDFYLYYLYEPKTYSDVKLTMVAENLGRNNNNVSLVCRLDYDNARWYEFSVESGGVWYLYAYDDGYHTLDNGGTTALKQGKETNEYGMTCEGSVITMYINGSELRSYTDRTYNLASGQVGFNISSLNVLPIIVNVKSFDIANP